MKTTTLADLQESIIDKTAFRKLDDYSKICSNFLTILGKAFSTRIVSPNSNNYFFYQYVKEYGHKITRPLNSTLFIESKDIFKKAFERFLMFLGDLKKYQGKTVFQKGREQYAKSKEINKVIYTIQQSIGSIGDSFENQNQSRKRIGQLFETLIKLVINEAGVDCESRTVNLPIPGFPGYTMSYELDLVFSRDKAIIASETNLIHASEIVASVKTTSKDRLDKVFLDKYLLSKLLGKNIPVIAIFLHDVQRARKGNSIFGINSTFKSNHFLGYTVALNKLDGVYYVDPRPEMISNERLSKHIQDFQQFLVKDLWAIET